MSFFLSALPRIAVCPLAAVLLSSSIAAAQTPTPYHGTPSAIPGIIQAEDFDQGGQGVAYNDTTAGNDGTQYRSEGPDIFGFANPDAPPEPTNFVIKNFALGEWMTYTVQVAANNRYDFQVRVASKVDTARFHIEIDGNDVTGSVAVSHTSTTTWENYQWVLVKRRVPLTAGTHVMKIVSDAEWVGLDAFNITVSNLGTPYGGTPAAIPGIIQAENFNVGGEGVAYHETDTINEGGKYRPTESVDIFTSPGSPDYVVKNFATGEWMVYSVNVATSGIYDFRARVATELDTSRFHIEIDGVNVTGSVAVAHTSTTTWENYQWMVAKTSVPLEAGTHYLVITSDEQWVGLDAIEIVPGYAGTPHGGTPAAVPGTIEAENFDDGGEGVAYHDTDSTNEGAAVGVQYRTNEAVDIFSFANPGAPAEPGNYVIKNFPGGEWMRYTINVQSAGQYDFKVRLASKISTGSFHIEIDDNDVTGTVAVPQTSTTTWEDYEWRTAKTNVPLSQGRHVMRIVSDTEWVGFDKVEIAAATGAGNPAGLLFRSGYEGVKLGNPRDCGTTKCQQDILGTDSTTGFAWPLNLFGGSNAFDMRTGSGPTPATIGNSMLNALPPGQGRNGSQGLYSEDRLNASGQYNAYTFYPTSEVPQLYVSYWVKFQPDLADKLHAGDPWRNIFEWKSDGDYRIEIGVVGWNGSPPHWHVKADNNANGNLPPHEYWREENSGVAVPINQWFKLEIFWRRGTGTNDRMWAAVNGNKIVDRSVSSSEVRGTPPPDQSGVSLMGPNNAPINRIFMNILYTGGGVPIYQWIDDIQIWSNFPTAAPGDAWYDPPYGLH